MTILAHDLRNQISPIPLRLNILRRRAQRDGRDPDVRDLDLVLRAVSRLVNLVGDILDVSRLEHGLFRWEANPLDVVAAARSAAEELSTPRQQIHVCERLPTPMRVLADAQRIRQCLDNLLSNAVKHSPAGGSILVEIASERDHEGAWWMRVDVVDDGPGIPAEVLPRVFERYVTGDASRGLGLGLHLAKRIAELHGGTLTVTSTPGRGSRFSLLLPCCADAMPDDAAGVHEDRPPELH